MEKKEVQQTIINKNLIFERASPEEFSGILRAIAPGTHVRAGLSGIIKAGKGAVIAVSNNWFNHLVDGGFRLNARFTSQKLIELSKMDGAIILSKDMKRIILANALLSPDNNIPTNETGTRHKAAERTARQAGTLVIAISERRNEITIYYKNIRYPLADSADVLRKANEHIQLIERQRAMFDKSIEKLTQLELRNQLSISQAVVAIQKGKIIQKLSSELEKYIIELGKEGLLLKPRLKELVYDIEKEANLIVKDYTQTDMKRSLNSLDELSYEELFDKESILKTLSYDNLAMKEPVRGWRLLSKTSLQDNEIASIIKSSGSLGKAIHSSVAFHIPVIGEEKARLFKEEADSLKLQIRSGF